MKAPSRLFFCYLVVVTLASSVYCAEKVTGGSSSSGVGQDVVITTPARQATAMPRRAGPKEQQQQKQQRQQLRQGVPSDPSIPAVGINDATLLPACRPGNGVICSDKDYTGLLGVQPANVDLTDDNFAYVGFNPSGEASLGVNTKVDLARRSGSTAAEAVAQGEVKGNVGTDVVTAKTETTNTLAGAGLKNNRLELAVPQKVTITLDQTESENTVDFRTNKPNFYYVLGQNFGLPVGLAKAADGVRGKH